jgi:hypothetical protein
VGRLHYSLYRGRRRRINVRLGHQYGYHFNDMVNTFYVIKSSFYNACSSYTVETNFQF